jgi:dGTPase
MIDYRDVTHPRNLRRHSPPKTSEGDNRSPAQRDRDRILYTSAFRRLVAVTQVASPDPAHVFHNRLTHSLQVAQVGRSLAEKLRQRQSHLVDEVGGIDPDVVEAACLAHDLGHPPFGHTAEEELNKLAGKAMGGFEGNAQSFRIVTKLAFKAETYGGLDLTKATLAAILKYPWLKDQNKRKLQKWGAYKSEARDFKFARELAPPERFKGTPEAELMDWADDVTYSVHDMEDFYRAGRIPMHLLARLDNNLERNHFFDDVYRRHSGHKDFFKRADLEEAFGDLLAMHWQLDEPYSGMKEQRSKLRHFTAQLIHRYVNGVELDNSTKSIAINEEYAKEVAILKELTWTYVIEAPALAMQREGQKTIIQRLFNVFADASQSGKKWSLFAPYYREQLESSSSANERRRIVVDLIAEMTEPQAIASYGQLTGADQHQHWRKSCDRLEASPRQKPRASFNRWMRVGYLHAPLISLMTLVIT